VSPPTLATAEPEVDARDGSVSIGQSDDCARDRNAERNALECRLRGGISGRAIRSRPLWLTLGYFAVLLLIARAYA